MKLTVIPIIIKVLITIWCENWCEYIITIKFSLINVHFENRITNSVIRVQKYLHISFKHNVEGVILIESIYNHILWPELFV